MLLFQRLPHGIRQKPQPPTALGSHQCLLFQVLKTGHCEFLKITSNYKFESILIYYL